MSNDNNKVTDIDIVYIGETIDSTDDNDPCIICLDENSQNMIEFPTKYSDCMCKYNIHLECLHKLLKKKCLMCEKKINILKDLKMVVLADFEQDNNNNNNDNDNERNITHITSIVIRPNVREQSYNQPFTRVPYTHEDRTGHIDRLRGIIRNKCCVYFSISFTIIIIAGFTSVFSIAFT